MDQSSLGALLIVFALLQWGGNAMIGRIAPGGPFKDKDLAGGLKWDEKPFTTSATNIRVSQHRCRYST